MVPIEVLNTLGVIHLIVPLPTMVTAMAPMLICPIFRVINGDTLILKRTKIPKTYNGKLSAKVKFSPIIKLLKSVIKRTKVILGNGGDH